MMNYLEIILLVVILVFAVVGTVRGLFKSLIGVLATVLAIIATYILAPYTGAFLIENTGFDDYVYEKTVKNIDEYVREKAFPEVTDSMKRQEVLDDMSRANQIRLIDEMNLPGPVKKVLEENNNESVYERLGVNTITAYIARSITCMVVNAVSMILVFLVLWIGLMLLSIFAIKASEVLPIVGSINRVGGFLLGLAAGVLVAWLVFTIYSFIFTKTAVELTKDSRFLTVLSDHNFITSIITNIKMLIS